jgi:hypothetical protein
MLLFTTVCTSMRMPLQRQACLRCSLLAALLSGEEGFRREHSYTVRQRAKLRGVLRCYTRPQRFCINAKRCKEVDKAALKRLVADVLADKFRKQL